jgi:protein required for attachment to host cells
MQKIWICIADNSRGKIFQMALPERQLREIDVFDHPEGRSNVRQLASDAEGRYLGGGAGQYQAHSSEPRVDRVKHENELFAKRLTERLEKGRVDHQYDALHVIAPPEFLGLLRKNMSNEIQKLVQKEVPKDVSWFNARDIEAYLNREHFEN